METTIVKETVTPATDEAYLIERVMERLGDYLGSLPSGACLIITVTAEDI